MITAFRIRDLTKRCPKLNSTQIAAEIGCKPGYVRTVWHRAGIFRGPHDPTVVYAPPPAYVCVPVAEYEKLLAAAAATRMPLDSKCRVVGRAMPRKSRAQRQGDRTTVPHERPILNQI